MGLPDVHVSIVPHDGAEASRWAAVSGFSPQMPIEAGHIDQ